ncbi:MAG: carbohydrate ABC transporter permease [candidate division KSB1 bacterium]|nr:carbohydrate ABC transporter permease [candidate division KSB1 bacterium]MDZ7304255.1 carbohydrate ABC transporter permease [candidate division KSB1 bacterium]MDZ7311730.1 carbohydrate ABC transporter permease [candidate division KSB1 bacterium]
MNEISNWRRLVIYLVLLIGGVVMIAPLYWSLLTSLKSPAEAFDGRWLPAADRIYWQNYLDVVRILPFGRFFLNSLFIAASVTILQVLTSSLAAYAFARLQFPGRDRLFLVYLATLMVPGQVTIIPLYFIIKYFGWIDQYPGVILPAAFTAMGTFLLRQFFMTIPRDLEDAAIIDGASRFAVYWKIILPLSLPALATLSIFVFINSWNDFFWPFIVLSDTEKLTLPVGLTKLVTAHTSDWTRLMAGTMIALLPALLVYIIFQKYINKGIVLTGFK